MTIESLYKEVRTLYDRLDARRPADQAKKPRKVWLPEQHGEDMVAVGYLVTRLYAVNDVPRIDGFRKGTIDFEPIAYQALTAAQLASMREQFSGALEER